MPKKKGKEEQTLDEKLKMAIVPKEEEPYKVPDNWVWTRLGNIAPYIQRGKSPKYVDESPIYVISQKCVQWTGFELDKARYTSDEVKYTEERFLKEGDILWNSTGTGTVGRVCILENVDENQKMVADSHVTVVRIANNIISKCILNYLISNNVQNNLDSLTTGSTNQKELTLSSVKNLAIPLPPIDEQKRIVNKLDYFFDKIQKVKEIIEEVKEKNEARKESILSKAFTGELTAKWRADNIHSAEELLSKINDEKLSNWEQEYQKAEAEGRKKPSKPKLKSIDEMIVPNDEIPYEIPNNWVWTKLGDITEKNQYGYTAKSSNQGEIKYLRITDIQDNKVVWNDVPYCDIKEDEFEKFRLRKDDIVVARTGATTGKSFLIKEINHKSVFASYLIRVRGITVLPEYLWAYMNAHIYWQQITEFSSGIAQPGVNAQKLENLAIPLPPIEEQKEIVRILDNIFIKENLINELISLEDKIQALEKSILSKAFRGELGTNSSDDIEAMELLKEILQK